MFVFLPTQRQKEPIFKDPPSVQLPVIIKRQAVSTFTERKCVITNTADKIKKKSGRNRDISAFSRQKPCTRIS